MAATTRSCAGASAAAAAAAAAGLLLQHPFCTSALTAARHGRPVRPAAGGGAAARPINRAPEALHTPRRNDFCATSSTSTRRNDRSNFGRRCARRTQRLHAVDDQQSTRTAEKASEQLGQEEQEQEEHERELFFPEAGDADDFAPDDPAVAAGLPPPPEAAEDPAVPPAAGWALLIMCLSYLHHSTTGFALPSFMPAISKDLHLQDTQTALLSLGYTALYAVALVPIGVLADRWDRMKLLTMSISMWSCLIMAVSHANSFEDLLLIRLLFAAAQAAQNPVCFSLIPELFPKNRSAAMALYNSAIYLGRALSFAALYAVSDTAVSGITGVTHINVEDFDPTRWSLLYTTGDSAAVLPLFNYNFSVDYGAEASSELWRSSLLYLGPPGFLLAWVMSITVPDPRCPNKVNLLASSRFFVGGTASAEEAAEAPVWLEEGMVEGSGGGSSGSSSSPPSLMSRRAIPGGVEVEAGAAAPTQEQEASADAAPLAVADFQRQEEEEQEEETEQRSFFERLGSGAFAGVTAAATVNDLGSWSLVAWQAQFFDRVYDIGPEVYAPLLACVIPVGGIIGGVGGGLVADRLGTGWGRAWLTSAANMAAAPVLALSIMADDYQTSLMYLTVGFALSEAWRAPSAVLVREIADESLGATSSAINLCIRNLLGGLGPLGVAVLTDKLDGDLQRAMLAIPACYAVSGVLFLAAQAAVMSGRRTKRSRAGGDEDEAHPSSPGRSSWSLSSRSGGLFVGGVIALMALLGNLPVLE